MMSHLPILIVGAGPTGLMLANELLRHNIPFRIIDKNPEPTQGSNATWIQSRTLEIFDAMGIVDSFLKVGHKCHAINFYDKGQCIGTLSLKNVNSAYPFILMLPQKETESLLIQKLKKSKIKVERPLELIDIKQTNAGVVSTVKQLDGNIETITSNWVIACDGAHGTIRDKCKIPFSGEDIPEQFMVADAEMNSFLPTDAIHVFFDKGTIFPERATIFSAFPWGEKQYRLTANLYHETPRQTFHSHEVKEVVAERTYGNFIVENVSWISPFWIHGKVVSDMQHNSIFLLGDAAHIHSPAGGQGMNMGLQDAYNLAWKLALVINHKAKSSILKSYQIERHPVANKIVETTNNLTNMMLFDKNFFEKLHQFSKDISKNETNSKVASELLQLDICYQDSPVIDYDEKPSSKSPQVGERVPDVIFDESKHLYKFFRNTEHNILIFSGTNPSKNKLDEMLELQKTLNQIFPEWVNTYLVSTIKIAVENLILDKNEKIHNQFDVKNSSVYVIRPDTYIGCFSKNLEIEPIKKYFNRIYI